MCSKDKDLVKAEFETLRQEIEGAKDRIFKLFVSGITLPLVIIGVLIKLPQIAFPVVYALPALLVAMFFRYQYERKVIYRAGDYIREKLDKESCGSLGWETWLRDDKHIPNEALEKSFDILIFIYYFSPIGIFIWSDMDDKYRDLEEYFFWDKFYILLFLFVLIGVWIYMVSTTMKKSSYNKNSADT